MEKSSRKYFVLPISNTHNDNLPHFKSNIFSPNSLKCDYLVGVFIKDMIVLPDFEARINEKKLKKKIEKLKKKMGKDRVIEGFSFEKAVVFKTKFPHHKLWFQILDSIISKISLKNYFCIR